LLLDVNICIHILGFAKFIYHAQGIRDVIYCLLSLFFIFVYGLIPDCEIQSRFLQAVKAWLATINRRKLLVNLPGSFSLGSCDLIDSRRLLSKAFRVDLWL
jgi:hypothetical protein